MVCAPHFHTRAKHLNISIVVVNITDYYICIYPAVSHADSVLAVIIFTCLLLLLPITLIATGYYFIRKQYNIKKGGPMVADHIVSC